LNLETANQRIIVYAISLTFVAVLIVVFGAVITSLDAANQTKLGNWFEDHWSSIWKTGVALLPAIITYLFGRAAGRQVGKTEAYNAAVAAADKTPTGAEAADLIRDAAKGQRVRVTV
jgi:hypothetical protein